MQSGTVASNGIELFYESRGPENGEAIVFVMGLSAQMVFWPESLLDSLVERGYRVIRFDNRDVGKSSRIRRRLKHGPLTAIMRGYIGLSVDAPYTLHDMVDDTVGLLDALGIDKAHLVGASMGGMISQLMAGKYPERVLSLSSIMSSNNSRLVPPPKPEARSRASAAAKAAARGASASRCASFIARWRSSSPSSRSTALDVHAHDAHA